MNAHAESMPEDAPRQRVWQVTTVDILAYMVVVGAGMAAVAAHESRRWHVDVMFTFQWTALIAGVTALGAAGAVWLDAKRPLDRTYPLRVIHGAVMAWLTVFLIWQAWPFLLLLPVAMLPGFVLASIAHQFAEERARKKGEAPPAKGPILVRMHAICMVGLVLLVLATPPLIRSRIAANESAAIAACKTYAGAQDIYRRTDYDGDGVLEYATSITGDHSLYETIAGRGDLTLVDQAFASASQVELGRPLKPKYGYLFKVLTGQGRHGPGGSKSYLINGNMMIGYAMVAWPCEYDVTGRNTFFINNTGTVYQNDMGPQTSNLVALMNAYDPGPGWVVSE